MPIDRPTTRHELARALAPLTTFLSVNYNSLIKAESDANFTPLEVRGGYHRLLYKFDRLVFGGQELTIHHPLAVLIRARRTRRGVPVIFSIEHVIHHLWDCPRAYSGLVASARFDTDPEECHEQVNKLLAHIIRTSHRPLEERERGMWLIHPSN